MRYNPYSTYIRPVVATLTHEIPGQDTLRRHLTSLKSAEFEEFLSEASLKGRGCHVRIVCGLSWIPFKIQCPAVIWIKSSRFVLWMDIGLSIGIT